MIIGIVVPHNFYAPWKFVRSTWGLGFLVIDEIGPDVAHNRNKILLRARRENEDVLLIDSDVEFTAIDVLRIKQHLDDGRGVITGVCVLGDIPYRPSIFKRDGELYDYVDIPDKISKVDGCGGAFLGISASVLAKLPVDPFYRVKVGEQMLGNDLSFCRILNQMNIDIWCDPEIQVGHIRSVAIYSQKKQKKLYEVLNDYVKIHNINIGEAQESIVDPVIAPPQVEMVEKVELSQEPAIGSIQEQTEKIQYDCRCFKCKQNYKSDWEKDLDGEGYCPDCLKMKNRIAEKINATVEERLAKNPPQPSGLAQYDALRKARGGYPNARDLGL